MSSESPQAAAATQQSQWQAQLAGQLSSVAGPELRTLMGDLTGYLNNRDASGRLPQDAAVRSSAMDQLNSSYGQAKMGSREAIGYGGLRSGEGRLSPGASNSAMLGAATSLDRDRMSALRNLEFQSAQSSLADYNQVLQLLGQGTKTAFGLAQGFGGASGAAIGGMSNQSQLGGILGGAASGASLGSVAGPWGALAGGVVGGVAGGLGGG